MKSNFKRLGDYIQIVDERNTDLSVKRFLGINLNKNFIRSVANTSGIDFSKYKIVSKDRFACNIMHVGRDHKLPIALYRDNNKAIVSPAYVVFEVINKNELLPEYLMMIFQRPEFDRFTWFLSDSSVRGGLEWERFCEIEVPIPDIDEQRNYVAIYSGVINNQSTYERSLKDLQLICDSYIENLIKNGKSLILGEYIEKLALINADNSIKTVMGLSVKKEFRTPKSTVNKEELRSYRVVKYNEFAYVQTTNNEKVLVIALSKFKHPIVVSSVNIVFKMRAEKQLLPEYLYLFLRRSEFDRYARFHSWGSVRETFNWEDMCAVKLPIPNIEVQKSIVAIHHTLETRKRINEQLKSMIAPLCPILMRGVIDNLSAV